MNRSFTKRIVGLTPFESDLFLDFLFKALTQNHDLQARVRWSLQDLAIWDNRSVYVSLAWLLRTCLEATDIIRAAFCII